MVQKSVASDAGSTARHVSWPDAYSTSKTAPQIEISLSNLKPFPQVSATFLGLLIFKNYNCLFYLGYMAVREQLAGSQFSPLTSWVLGIELGHQGCWQVLQSHLSVLLGATFQTVERTTVND